MKELLSIFSILLLGSVVSQAQTMTFDASATHPGYTITNASWWNNQIIYPNNPNVNGPHMRITKNSGCFSVVSIRTAPFGGGGGTWQIRTNRGHTYNTMIPGTSTVHTLNFNDIQWIEMALIDPGTGGPNNTFDFDDVVYTEPVYTPASAPGLSSNLNNTCPGTPVVISATGNLNDATNWVFYSGGSCGGSPIQNSASATLNVSPSVTTTYSARGIDVNGCVVAGSCGSVTVTVNSLSVAPSGITGTTTICDGESTTLTLSGGTAGTGATAQWFSTSCGTGSAGTGNSILVSPTSNTTYYVRYSGTCNTTTCASVPVTVNTLSVAPAGITGTTTICDGESTTLTLSGGTAGTGATAQWFSTDCGTGSVGTGNSVLVTPSSNTTYYVRYSGTCNTTTCASTSVSVPCVRWTGTVSTDWNTDGNWSAGVPDETEEVVIDGGAPNQPLIQNDPDAPLVLGALTIESAATVTVAAGKALTVSGTVDNSGTILLESDATGTGTIITNGTVGGSGTFTAQQYLTGSGGSTPDGRHWYVAPTVGSTNSGAYSAAGDNRLWSHDETQEVTGTSGTGWAEITDDVTALTPMRGYAARLGATETVEYTGGTFNTGNMSITDLTRTGTESGRRGYQLLANPYPSFLDWGDAYSAGSINLLPSIWYRTEDAGSMVFATYNALSTLGVLGATEFIHPGQAFWVQVDGDGNTGILAVNNSMRSHRDGETMRDGIDITRLTLTNGIHTDETAVFFNDLASNGADIYDSEKQMAPAEVPQLWSNVEDMRMAINGIHGPVTQPTVSLGIRVQSAGEYTITATELDLPVGAWLEDIGTGVFQSLDSEPSYTFTSEGGTFNGRFVLHFSAQVVGLDERTTGIDIFSYERNINIILNGESKGTATVMDMAGRAITTATLQGQRTTLTVDVPTGVYLVRVETERGVETRRVMLR